MSPGPGGILARRVIPVVFGLQIAVGYLRVAGQSEGLYPAEVGVAFSVLVVTRAHQGTIEVRSREGEGTTFVIEIPVNLEERITRP